ncbi:MAG TPA: hypothetical protein VH684_30095 [Xanthobacteraceae bacterium]|jgi:hypothetical protein
MAEIDLGFLARQNERILAELGNIREELALHSATIARLDHTVTSQSSADALMLAEMRAIRSQVARLVDRINRVEDRVEEIRP